jgi:hypothetical protein
VNDVALGIFTCDVQCMSMNETPTPTPTSPSNDGPSPSTVAWSQFIVENLTCLVLLTLVFLAGLHSPSDPTTRLADMAALVTMILGVVRSRGD